MKTKKGGFMYTFFIILLLAKMPLANYYLNHQMTSYTAKKLAKWDVVVTGVENRVNNPNLLSYIRQQNPNIKLIPYVASEEIPSNYASHEPSGGPLHQLYESLPHSCYLKDKDGNQIFFWGSNKVLNLTNNVWVDHLVSWVKGNVKGSGYWDGIFYDNIWNDISWLNPNIDADNNRVADNASTLNSNWQTGVNSLLYKTRSQCGSGFLIVINGGDQRNLPYINGSLRESFNKNGNPSEWKAGIEMVKAIVSGASSPPIVILNFEGTESNVEKMRFGLATTLLVDHCYFSYDAGLTPPYHCALRWYPEYDLDLGNPTGQAYQQDELWIRKFSNGIVIVNPSYISHIFYPKATYYDANGKSYSGTLTVKGRKGYILVKKKPDENGNGNGGANGNGKGKGCLGCLLF